MSSTMQHVAAGEVDVEVLHDADDAAGSCGRAVGRAGHEVDLDGHRDGPDEVGHEDEGALQHADERAGRDPRSPPRLGRRAPARGSGARSADDQDLAGPGRRGARSVEGSGPTDGRGYPGVAPPTGRGHEPQACRWRSTRRPGASSQARRSPRATARTRSTAAPSGGYGSASQRRTARRASAAGAAASALASVGSRPAASSSSEVGVVAQQPAWRARTAATSRSAMASSSGQQLVADPVAAEGGSSVGRVLDRSQAEVLAQRPGLAPAQAEQRVAVGPHAGQPVEPGAPQEVEQHRLGLVVGRVAGEHVGRRARRSGPPGRGPRGSGPGATSTRSARKRHRSGRRRPARPRPRPRAGPQPVVDVDGRHPAAGGDGQHEEGERVGAAGDGAGDRRAGGRETCSGRRSASMVVAARRA